MLSRLRTRRLCFLLALGLAVLATGCGRKGALFLPPDDTRGAPDKAAVPVEK